jgi:uncharacterized protein
MSEPAKAPEPSIDEILASIRRSIVPDDDASKPAARKMASRKPVPADARGSPAEDETTPSEGPGDTARAMGAMEGASAPEGPLLSPHATAAVDTAFHSLTHTVLSQNPRTLEDLVRDMLKPMLKEWLDANLPDMVERLVRAEIERVSRRG